MSFRAQLRRDCPAGRPLSASFVGRAFDKLAPLAWHVRFDRTSQRLGSVFYGWWLVGTAGYLLTLMSVNIFQGRGVFLSALIDAFGWSRTAISGAFALSHVEGAALGPFVGMLVDRFGTRRMVLIGHVVMGAGFILFSFVQELWHFYLAFVIIAIGSGLGGWLAMITLVNNWFVRRRSIAMASAMSGIHLGGFLVPVLAVGIESHGFRVATFGIGVFLWATVVPATRIIRDHPEDYGLRPDGDPPAAPRPSTEPAPAAPAAGIEPDFTARQALRTPAFWILSIAHTASTVSIVSMATHLVPKLTDIGLPLSTGGLIVLLYTAIALPSQFVAGYVADRLPKPPVISTFMLCQGIAMLVIANAESLEMALVFAVIWGFAFGGRVPVMTAIRGEYFGRKAFATIMGLSMLPNNIGMVSGPLFAGYMFDEYGSYFVPFVVFAAMNFAGAALILFVRRPRALTAAGTTQPRIERIE